MDEAVLDRELVALAANAPVLEMSDEFVASIRAAGGRVVFAPPPVLSDAVEGTPVPFTVVSLERLETFRGSIGDVFSVRLPGGRDGDRAWWVPGVPSFAPGEEVVLMLEPGGRRGVRSPARFGRHPARSHGSRRHARTGVGRRDGSVERHQLF